MSALKTLDSAAATPAAVANFLRSVERRAAFLAELQCGETAHGDRALKAAIESFAAIAPIAAPETWPHLFWSNLLQNPTLNTEPLAPYWPGDFACLARLDFGPRAVLLLRVVAGMDDTQAAAIFGVEPADYRQALQGALPQRTDGSLDGEAWLALNDEARYVMQHLPPERVAAIARIREEALLAPSTDTTPRQQARRALPTIISKPGWLSRLRTSIGLT
ncbi:MAG: hypothetical protein E6Q88_00485 [Lysobacteraceae bacterium]|nr:MAG: hypothetical protein E6Q88_00485 [Xanthomonadaceae bacterium]